MNNIIFIVVNNVYAGYSNEIVFFLLLYNKNNDNCTNDKRRPTKLGNCGMHNVIFSYIIVIATYHDIDIIDEETVRSPGEGGEKRHYREW